MWGELPYLPAQPPLRLALLAKGLGTNYFHCPLLGQLQSLWFRGGVRVTG